jgi:hypothetical protein
MALILEKGTVDSQPSPFFLPLLRRWIRDKLI